MSIRPSAESPISQNKSQRKRRQAEVVSFEDLLAAHQTDRESGKLPPEGVVLIGVDTEFQLRMRAGLPDIAGVPKNSAANFGSPNFATAEAVVAESTLDTTSLNRDTQHKVVNPPTLVLAADDLNNEQPIPHLGEPKSDVPNFGEPNFGTSDSVDSEIEPDSGFDIESLIQRRTAKKTYTVQPASRVEVILSAGELTLLRWYWEKGTPVPNCPMARLVTGANGEGSRRMAAQAGLVWNTFRNYTRALSTKYAIDIVKPDGNTPRLYIVWHFSAILERVRKAGLTGVVRKNGGGRELVDAQSRPAPPREDLTVVELRRIFAGKKSGGNEPATFGSPNFGISNFATPEPKFGPVNEKFGEPKFDTPIRNKEYPSLKEVPPSASSVNTTGVPKFGAPKSIVDALFERTGRTDSEAARILAKTCVEANATITHEEIARLIRCFHIPASITNPVGLLIRTLASRCDPQSLAKYREQWRHEDEQGRKAREYERLQTEQAARMILEDPTTNEADKNWARQILSESEDGAPCSAQAT
jgi:hypothetical protein